MGFLCRYGACLISGTPKYFQGHQFRGNLSSPCQPGKMSMPISKQCWKTCTSLVPQEPQSVFCLTNKAGIGSRIDLDSNCETQCLSYSQLWPVFGSNWTKQSIKCLYHFKMKYQPPSSYYLHKMLSHPSYSHLISLTTSSFQAGSPVCQFCHRTDSHPVGFAEGLILLWFKTCIIAASSCIMCVKKQSQMSELTESSITLFSLMCWIMSRSLGHIYTADEETSAWAGVGW